jgi:MFS family permease
MSEIITILCEPNYRRLWLGEITSLFGDWFTYVAVSVLALEKGEGAVAIAVIFVAHNLPHAVVAPLAGFLTDRFDRKNLMMAANYLQGALTLGMVAAAAAEQLTLLQILLFARISASAVFLPAQTAALPRLVDKQYLATANALTFSTASVVFAAGVALGGVAVAFVGVLPALLFDASTFFISNLFLRGLPALPPAAEHERFRLREVFAFTLGRKALFEAVFAKAPLAFASGAAWVALVDSTKRLTLVTAGAMTLGLFHFGRAFGSALGPLVHKYLNRVYSFLLTLSGILMLALTQNALAALVGAVLWGVGITANWVRAQTKIQTLAPDAMLGRLSALDFFSFTAASSLGALAGAVFMNETGIRSGAAWVGIFGATISWILLFAMTRPSRLSAKELVC